MGQEVQDAEKNLTVSKETLTTREKELETLEKQKEALQSLSSFSFTSNGKNFKSNFLQANNYTTLDGKALSGTQMNDVQAALTKVMSSNDATIKKLNKTLEEYGIKLKNAEDKTTLFNEAARRFKEQLNQSNNAIKEAKTAVKEQEEVVEALETSFKRLQSSFGTGANAGKGSVITDYLEALRKEMAVFKAKADEAGLQQQTASPLPGLQENINLQNRLNVAVEQGNEDTREAIKVQSELDSTFDQIGNRFKYLLSFMNAYHVSLRAMKQTFNDIRDIDKAFASIAMVTDMDISQLWGQYDEYAKIANELGQSTESVIKSSALYYQQGLNTAQSLTLTKDTMKLATLANIDFEQSTKLMTAALRAFHMELDSGAHITDVYSELAANAAANVQDIAYAMSKTSSIAASAGMSFENTAAMLTTMIEVTQEAPENLGTAMKSIIARFTEVKKNVSDIEGDIETIDINKVDAALKSVGISLKDQAGQLRDLDQVFLELSAEWNDLDRNTQRYIATLAAGSRQQSRFLALMENYDRTMELIETAQDSAGRSSEQFAKYADSVQNKVNKLKNTWEQFRVNLIPEKTVKQFLDLANQLLTKFSKINLGQVLGIGAWGLTIGKQLIQGIIQGLRQSSNLLSTGIEELRTKISTGSTKIQLQTNLSEINTQIDQLKIKLNEAATTLPNLQLKTTDGNLQTTITTLDQLEQELNQVGLTVNATNTNFKFLDFTTDEADITLSQLWKEGKITEDQYRNLTRAIQLNAEALRNENGEIVKTRQNYEQLSSTASQTAKQLASAKTWGTVGNAIGSAVATTAMMAFTGTFSGEQIANTIAIQMGSTVVMTAVNAVTAALGRSAGTSFGAAFMAGGGAAALWIAGITAAVYLLYKVVNKQLQKWKENDQLYIAQKKYEATQKKIEELSEKLDEQNKLLEETENKWSSVKSADKTFQELSNKINLTEEEQQKLNEATQILAEEMPVLIDYYDAEGNAVITINENYKKQIRLLEEKKILMEKQAALSNLQVINEQNKSKNELYDIARLKVENQVTRALDQSGMEDISADFWEDPSTFRTAVMRGGSYSASDEFIKALQQSINTIRGTAYDISGYTKSDIEFLLKNWESYGSDQKKILELTRENLIENLKEAGKLEDEEYEALKNHTESLIQQRQELLIAANSLYDIMFKESLLKYDDSERKDLMKSMFNNILLDDEKFIEEYNKKREELGRDLEGQELTDFVESQINEEQFEKISKEVETLTDETYELVVKYYSELKNLSDQEKNELIEKIRSSGAELIAADMEEQNKKINQDIQNEKNKYFKSQGYVGKRYIGSELTDIYGTGASSELLAAFEILENSSITAFKQITATAQQMGEESGDQYIIAMANAIQKGNLSEAAKLYLNSIDWEEIDFVHQKEQIEKLAEDMAAQGLATSKEVAEGIINDFITSAGEENLGIVLEIRTEADAVSIQDSAEQAYEILQGEMDSFTILFGLKPDQNSLELTQEQYNNMIDSIKALNEAEGSPYSIDLSEYFDGQNLLIKNTKKLTEELKAPLAGYNQLLKKYDDLIKKQEESGELTEDEQNLLNTLGKILPQMKKIQTYVENIGNESKDLVEIYKELVKLVGSLSSEYQSIVEEQEENGFLSSKSLESLTDIVNDLNGQLKDTALAGYQLDISSILSRNEKGYYANTDALRAFITTIIAAAQGQNDLTAEQRRYFQSLLDDLNEFDRKRAEQIEETTEAIEEENDALERQKELEEQVKEATEAVTKAEEDLKKAEEDLADARQKVADAYDEIAEKEKAVLEVQNELNEAMYGTGDKRQSTLNGLYNYEQLLKQLNNDLEIVKHTLENPVSSDQIGGTVAQYGQIMHNRKVTLLSQQVAYQNAASEARSILGQYSDYYKEINGRLLADVAKLNAATMPDKVKDEIETLISTYNDQVDKIHDVTTQIQTLEKEFADFQKTYRDKYINLQEKVISTLKEQAQEELTITKDKYTALEEENNEYLEALEAAINKQRELRNMENEEEDLAQKEKKLSLMQRDTSGANQKDILKQQQDVDKTRQNLNDKKIDSIVKSLKELYKEQKKSRDAEVQYMEAVLNNAVYIEEANAVISSWQTADDLISWFYEHSTEVETMTQEQLINYSEELKQMYYDREIYMNTSIEDFTNMLNVTQSEINAMTANVSEHLSSEINRAFETVQDAVAKTIQDLEDKLQEAQDEVIKAKDNLKEALAEVAEQIEAVKDATKALASAREELASATKEANSAELELKQTTSSGDSTTSTDSSSSHSTIISGGASITPHPLTGNVSTTIASSDSDRLAAAVSNIKGSDGYWWAGSDNYPTNTKNFINSLKDKLGINIYYGEANGNKYFGKSESILKNLGVTAVTKYKQGGLVNYTGPAWVDGTPANPEAFLSAEDTRNIAHLTDVLGSLYSSINNFNTPSAAVSNNTVINVSVNVDGISSDYDVDRAVEKVKQSIVEAANQVGSTVILYQ